MKLIKLLPLLGIGIFIYLIYRIGINNIIDVFKNVRYGYLFLVIILLGLVFSLAVGRSILQNMLSTSGIFIGKAEKEINFYKTQNAILSEELLIASALTNIIEKAHKSGFVSGDALMVIKTSRPLAVRP